jgi:two-component system, cell cycle sensor histidine kinase and response regulator CckA
MPNRRSSSDPNLSLPEFPVSYTGIRTRDDSQHSAGDFWKLAEPQGAGSLAELMFEQHPRPMWICDAATLRFLAVNQAALTHYGYDRVEFLNRSLLDIQREAITPQRKSAKSDSVPSGLSYWRHLRKDGSSILVEAATSQLEFLGKRALVVAITDVTDLFDAEETVLRLVSAMEQTAESVVISDTSGVMTYVNPAFERVTGYTKAELVGQNARVLKSGQHPPEFYLQIWQTLDAGRSWSGQIINRKKNGTLYREEMTISPVRDAGGKIINYVAVKRDVTRELMLEEQLRQAQKMEAVGHLAGGIAHDFNNLLTVIHGNAALLQEDQGLDQSYSDLVTDILSAADRATALTRQLLVVSRKQAMQPEPLDLNDIVESLGRMFERVIGESISLRSTCAPRLRRVNADRGMLHQVLLNLCLNARDAMPEGGILLIRTSDEYIEARSDLSEVAETGHYVCLHVTDTGCGIPSEHLERIFDPFFTTKDVGKGTGLGLATVYSIIKQHRGWIETTSTMGQGTTFRVFLPALLTDSMRPKADPRPSSTPKGNETILVVEDDPAVRRTLCKLLERCGYSILKAESGPAALAVWEVHKDRIKLLLTDIMMPGGMLGPQLARRMRAEKPNLRVVFTSGYDPTAVEGTADLGEGVSLLHKPWLHNEVAEIIRGALDQAMSQNQTSSDRSK